MFVTSHSAEESKLTVSTSVLARGGIKDVVEEAYGENLLKWSNDEVPKEWRRNWADPAPVQQPQQPHGSSTVYHYC